MNNDIRVQAAVLDLVHREFRAAWDRVRSYLEHEDVEAAWDALRGYFDVSNSVFAEREELRVRIRRDWARVKRLKREDAAGRTRPDHVGREANEL